MSKKHDHLSIPGVADAKRPMIFRAGWVRMFETIPCPLDGFETVPTEISIGILIRASRLGFANAWRCCWGGQKNCTYKYTDTHTYIYNNMCIYINITYTHAYVYIYIYTLYINTHLQNTLSFSPPIGHPGGSASLTVYSTRWQSFLRLPHVELMVYFMVFLMVCLTIVYP